MTTSPTSCEDKRPRLYIDIETYSDIDIKTCGSFRYINDPSFEVLLIAWTVDNGAVCVYDLAIIDADRLLQLLEALRDPRVVKVAHNCAFEREALARLAGFYLPPEQWEDTKNMAAYNGLPVSLEGAGAALQLEQQKMKEGAALIRYFCKPCRPSIANGGRTRNLPEHAPEKWETFKKYCGVDVVTMRQIYHRLHAFPVPEWERRVFALDARINERGVLIDRDLAEAAVEIDAENRRNLLRELQQITGLHNPNSPSQLLAWLQMQGLDLPDLTKQTVADAQQATTDQTLRRVLELRQLLSKTSVKKYHAMLASASPTDDRLRGTMAYYGAGRTGRWAGRLVQPQNLPQNHLDNIAEVRELVRGRDLDAIEMCFDSTADTLAQLIRTALIAKPGHTFLVADYSAIEARVIAYLSGCEWRQRVFAEGGDIYCQSAAQMFGVPVEKHGINGHLRQKGKIAELACGYG